MPNPFAYLSYVVLGTFTPGPNNIMSMVNASRFGFRNTVRFMSGIVFGFFLILALSCAFTLGLYEVLPSVKPYMTAVGALYMLWLAWKIASAKPVGEAASDGTNTFAAGLALQFLNPKAMLYGLTAASTFIVPYYKSPVTLLGFSLFMALMGMLSVISWATFGSVFARFLTRHHRPVSIVMGLLLVYSAVSLYR